VFWKDIDLSVGENGRDLMARLGAAGSVTLILLAQSLAGAAPILIGHVSDSNWDNPQATSPTLLVRMEDEDIPSATIGAWALQLRITPDAGAIGSVNFDVASTPSDYLFSGRPTGQSIVVSPNLLVAMDVDLGELFSLPPVVIPPTGASLLDISFVASSDAHGLFLIEALPLQSIDIGSYWTASGDFNGQSFANETNDGIVLATLVVGQQTLVPEPNTMCHWLVMCLSLVVRLHFWRRARI
jgi:hypothetical protein